ncbi:NUDIX hydrolase [Pantoea allii]|uniref:NUDIX hydrolase n=1 Tax=Pantoea allii TaxID=574096 RepID=UPI0024B6501F|nr:NUDIX hydrolase [Pantoea allii]MDJ0089819.1 NUDIX hydrolase [Pantoea allii]
MRTRRSARLLILNYVVTVSGDEINTQGWSENEKSVIASARWWTIKALSETADTIYPANILRLLP